MSYSQQYGNQGHIGGGHRIPYNIGINYAMRSMRVCIEDPYPCFVGLQETLTVALVHKIKREYGGRFHLLTNSIDTLASGTLPCHPHQLHAAGGGKGQNGSSRSRAA